MYHSICRDKTEGYKASICWDSKDSYYDSYQELFVPIGQTIHIETDFYIYFYFIGQLRTY